MSIKKTVAIAAAAGALTAVAMPALALENEVHGSYTFNTVFSNFAKGDGSNVSPAALKKANQMNNYFEQRARLQYIAKASDDLKMVTQFELDTRFGGVSGTATKYSNSNDAGKLDADGVSLETKHVYLDFNLGKSFNTKLGIQPYKDTIKGLFIDADLPMIMTTTKAGAYTLGVGFSRFNEVEQGSTTTIRLGDRATDLFVLDNTFAFSKDTKAALSYYYLADYITDKARLVNTLGLSGETKLGSAVLSGFVALQAGHIKDDTAARQNTHYHGWAANVAAKAAVGPGSLKSALLFVSGNNNTAPDKQDRGWVTPLNSYNESGMMIIARNTANSPSNTDDYIRRTVTNLALLSVGYDANLSQKVYLNSNVGFGWTPASGEVAKNKADFMGTELNIESGYKVSDNLTLRAQAAYMVLGGLYKDASANDATKNPENPYTMRLLASFKF